jgi:pimeloyl-ACP methyl ester carboxylesterase
MSTTLERLRFTSIGIALGFALSPPLRAQPAHDHGPDTVTVHSGSLSLRGLLWRPAGEGHAPVVLFNHGSGPADDAHNPAVLAEAFTRHGYEFFYLYRRGAGLSKDQGTNSAELMTRAEAEGGRDARNRMQSELLDAELGDVVAGLSFLRARRDVDARQLILAGHSFGGQLSLLLAARDTAVRAVVVFGPAAASWNGSPVLRDRLIAAVDEIAAPVFFIHAANDYSVLPGKELAAEMTRLGRANRLAIYPPVGRTAAEGHDFVHSSIAVWQHDVFAFLDESLRAPRP